MSGRLFSIPVRYYQIARLYGPGMPECGEEGLHERRLEGPVSQVGLVLVHCWNLGEPNGPYPFAPGTRCPGEAADWVPVAHAIVQERIRPALEAAREADVAVFHLAQSRYADRYAQYRKIASDPALKPPLSQQPVEGCVRTITRDERWQDEYGARFPGAVWETHAENFDIAESVRPLENEHVVLDGWRLNGLCRRLNIDTLFYAGFMADLCLVNIPGAIREMTNKFGYRCVALRDGTTAYEYPETHEGGWMTFAAIRIIESGLGYSATCADFITAAKTAASVRRSVS